MFIDKYKQENLTYLVEGITYDNEVSVLGSFFDFCGCGQPEEALKYAMNVMRLIQNKDDAASLSREEFGKAIDALWNFFPSHGAGYFTLYQLDKLGMEEHGGSTPGWLTAKGKEVLSDLEEYFKNEDTEEKEEQGYKGDTQSQTE